ncbi:uncharacterized protein LOC144147285 isoform X2 [Haemaphysalis longicornis]
MLSQEVIIKDPAILEVLSQAREGDGVHIYLDVPLTAPGLRLGTTIRDTDKGDVKDITYTALLRARAKDAKFALRIVDDIAYYALEVGMDEQNFRPYFDRKDGGQKWSPNRFDHPDALRLEKGQLVCIQMAMANKKEFTNVSLERATLTHISIGGRAIITGSYVPNDTSIDGIIVDLQIRGGRKYPQILGTDTKTFSITVSVKGTLVAGDGQYHLQNMHLKSTDFIYLIFQNIEIQSMEFHSGLQALG